MNAFELVPKYRCDECGRILICECERGLSARLLPHQTRRAATVAFERVPVDGFASEICPFCRGTGFPTTPRGASRGGKGKVRRFYWREIRRTYFQSIVEWLDANAGGSLTLIDFQKSHPTEAKRLHREALVYWKAVHRRAPRYGTEEEDQESFLGRCHVPIEEMRAEYQVVPAANGHPLGRWVLPSGDPVTVEAYVRGRFEADGWTTFDCERRLIATLYATLLSPAIQDPTDPKILRTARSSTLGWTRENPQTPIIHMLIPADFGTSENFKRREDAYRAQFDDIRASGSVSGLFQQRLEFSAPLRDYLNAHDQEVELARAATRVIPREQLMAMLEWVAQAFSERVRGWPDIFAIRNAEYGLIEVKSPDDRLSQDQMRWFAWAIPAGIPAGICKVLPSNRATG